MPERWYSKPDMIKHKNAFAPFSLGPENCVGKNRRSSTILLTRMKADRSVQWPSWRCERFQQSFCSTTMWHLRLAKTAKGYKRRQRIISQRLQAHWSSSSHPSEIETPRRLGPRRPLTGCRRKGILLDSLPKKVRSMFQRVV